MENKLKAKVEYYYAKWDLARRVCASQKSGDTSFQAEVEEEALHIAEKQLEVAIDIFKSVVN